MSGTVSTRWYFSDWMSDQNVRACSLAARGLWMDMLCIASANKGKDHGFVMIAGRGIATKEIARHVGSTSEEIEPLLAELELNAVYSRDRRGIIYCRRMVRAEKNRTNGRLGGNPNLLNKKENQESVGDKAKAHIPEPEPSQDSLFPEVGNRAPRAKTEPKPPKQPTALEIARKELFDRGKEVLGDGAGGFVQKLLAAKHGNIALARAAIEQASTMDDPRQYVGGILRGAEGNGSGNRNGHGGGFADLKVRLREAASVSDDPPAAGGVASIPR